MQVVQSFASIRLRRQGCAFIVQLFRPEARNSINGELLQELLAAVAQAEQDRTINVIILEGLPDFFCTGMDFQEFAGGSAGAPVREGADRYYELLHRISTCSKIVIARVEGQVNAGGVGIVAACDFVIAGPDASFGLSEALFGLLPACVLPFLIRRTGYQKALWLTLSTQPIGSARAAEIGLVDELSGNPDDSIRKMLIRLARLQPGIIQTAKSFMGSLWIMDEGTRKFAVDTTTRLAESPEVRANISNFVNYKKFPWEK